MCKRTKPICKVQKKKPKCAKEGYAKRRAVKALRRTWFLVIRVPQNQEKNFPKDEKVKKGTSVSNTSSKRCFVEKHLLL